MLITWEDKLHDKMTSAYSKSCGYKKFSVHTNTKKYRFQIVPLWRAFSKSSVFVDLFMRISADGSRIRNNKVAFSNLSGIVWTGPKYLENYTVYAISRQTKWYNNGLNAGKVIRVHRDFQNYPREHTPTPPSVSRPRRSLFRSKHLRSPNPFQ